MVKLTCKRAEALLKRARNPEEGKPIGNNTRLFKVGQEYHVKLHGNTIIRIVPGDYYFLYTAGWPTVTTKRRLNELTPAQIYQHNHIWYIWHSREEQAVPFHEGMVIDSIGRIFSNGDISSYVREN